MTKSELIERMLLENPDFHEKEIEKVVHGVFEAVTSALSQGKRVELRGFGTFSVKTRAAREGRNPKTGRLVSVAEKALPHFKTGKELRQRLNDAVSDLKKRAS